MKMYRVGGMNVIEAEEVELIERDQLGWSCSVIFTKGKDGEKDRMVQHLILLDMAIDPDGKPHLNIAVDASGRMMRLRKDEVEKHNKALDKHQLEGLDTCEVGDGTYFYWSDEVIKTFTGMLVEGMLSHDKKTVSLTRGDKLFLGYLPKEDGENFLLSRVS